MEKCEVFYLWDPKQNDLETAEVTPEAVLDRLDRGEGHAHVPTYLVDHSNRADRRSVLRLALRALLSRICCRICTLVTC